MGNLSYRTSWRGLKDHCKQAGTVVYSDVQKEPSTGRSKGCGTVEFSTAMEAAMAIQMLHDSELDGRRISVGAPSAKGRMGQGAPLGPEVLAEMSRLLEDQGGAMDLGRFASAFAGVKKRQLTDCFSLTPEHQGASAGRWRICLPGAGPRHTGDHGDCIEDDPEDDRLVQVGADNTPALPLGCNAGPRAGRRPRCGNWRQGAAASRRRRARDRVGREDSSEDDLVPWCWEELDGD